MGSGRVNAHAAVLFASTYGNVAPITSNTTWSSGKYVKGVVTIQSGATLTITGIVRMAKDARFEVKPNAKLVIDGATITRSTGCYNDRWDGIYVSGNSTASQTQSPTLFGTVVLKNNAVVEHAKEALNNFGLTSGGALDWNAIGGVVQATSTTFRNNRRSAQFMAYTNTNALGNPTTDKGYFSRCTFTVDDNMLGTTTLYAHISQWQTRVNVNGCKFENLETTTTGNPTGRGQGIYSLDAIYTVKEYCTIVPPFGTVCPPQNRTPSTFKGLQHGIEAVGTGSAPSTVTVRECEFTDNHRGIVLNSSAGSIVERNIFRPGLFGPYPVGLYINQTSSYTVQCNTFTSLGGTPPVGHPNYRLGVSSLNCGAASPIQKNTFTSLHMGAEALGSNRNAAGTGLRYINNTFNGNYLGIIVQNSGSLPNQGIASAQGSSSTPAGNLFSAHSTLVDIFNLSQPTTYYRHAGTGDWTPTIAGNITISVTTKPWALWSCTSEQQSMAMYGEATGQQQQKEAELSALTDGGTTQQLQTQVVTTDNDEDMQVYGSLMQRSPNLSEQVLLSAVERPAPLPNAMLRDVLTANPQAGKSGEVMTGLADRPQQLPEYMVWQVEESAHGVSPIEKLRADIAMLATERQQTADALVDRWLMPAEGETLQRDSALALLTAKDDEAALYRLALMAAQEGEATAAAAHANRRAELTGQGNDRFGELAVLLATLNAQGRTHGQLTEGELAQVTDLATDEGIAGHHARGILQHLGLTTIDLPVLPVPPLPQQRKAMPSMEEAFTLNVFPNPGTDHITIDYTLEENGNSLFEVLDVQGRILLQQQLVGQRDQVLLDIRSLSAGSYLYRLSQGEVQLHSGTFSVSGR